MSDSINHIENLIRVVASVPDKEFDIRNYCQCAIGHATRDEYFIGHKFKPTLLTFAREAGEFFDIPEKRADALFIQQVNYGSRLDVLAALRVLLMEKQAQECEGIMEPLDNFADAI